MSLDVSAHALVRCSAAVPHVHFHVIPREAGDGGLNLNAVWPDAPPIGSVEPDFGALNALAEKLQKA